MVEYSNGTVRKMRGGWQGVISYQVEKGKQKQFTKMLGVPCEPGTNKGRPAALKALAEWRAELMAKESAPASPKVSTQTVGEYCNTYVTILEKTGSVERSTVADYRKCLRMLGKLDGILMADLTPSMVQAWEVGLLERLSPVTVGKAHRVLRQCMKHAEEVGDLPRDPTRGVKPPKRPTKQPNALDAAGRARLISILKPMEPTPLKVGACLALYAGMRCGEVCGLRWRNVDLEGRTLWVREAIGRGIGALYSKEPKTGGSRRDIPLPAPLVDVLKARRLAMVEECMRAGVPFSGDMYVIGNIEGGFHGTVYLGKQWTALARSYGLRGVTGEIVTFHDLRHTFATTAVAQGVDVKTVSSILGHANAAMTLNIYASADPDAKRRAADTVAEAMAAPVRMAEVIEFPTGTEG